MNAGSSLAKYAPDDGDAGNGKIWRKVSNLEGLNYVATSFLSKDPEIITHLKVRVNLGMSDASAARQNRIKKFFKSLHQYEHIEVLDLGHCQISDHTCRLHVATMLERNSTLVQIKLNNNAFTDAGARICFQQLVNTKISKVSLATNNLTGDFIDYVTGIIGEDLFEELDFAHTEIGANGVKLLAGLLPNLDKLSKLDLTNVRAGDEGAIELAKAFDAGGNTSITTLNLTENNIGRVGVTALAEKFVPTKNEVVTTLNLSKNYFGDQGFGSLQEMLKTNNTMKVLQCNKVGLTATGFDSFCEMMDERYGQEFGPYPDLEQLAVGGNGLGNPSDALFSMLKSNNCTITKLGYDINDVDNYGCKLFRYFFCGVEYKSHTSMYKNRLVEEEASEDDTPEIIEKKREISKRRKNFQCLTLKGNLITSDGAEHLATLIDSYEFINELDVRKNSIGLGGAIQFKKAFRSIQCDKANFGSAARKFKLHVLPKDVTVPGVNHLAIGIRQHAETIKKHVQSKSYNDAKPEYDYHKYTRHPEMTKAWESIIGHDFDFLNGEQEEFKKKFEKNNSEEKDCIEKSNPKQKFDNLFKRKTYRDKETFHLGLFSSPLSEYDSKPSIEIYGESDEKENLWEALMDATYSSCYIKVTERGDYKWNSSVFGKIKSGWGSMVANQLYRWGILLRARYYSESAEYIKDFYLHRYCKNNWGWAMRTMNEKNVSIDALIGRLVIDDIKDFWEVVMHQTCSDSEGLTMFEFALKYGDSPLIDVVRQFINVFPAAAYANPNNSKSPVFLLQQIAHTGKSYRDLCLESKDKIVKRYAEAKKLILFRFQEIEPVYVSKFVTISKVEDLLLTEEHDDDDRFFYMRRIANTGSQKDENLSRNEFEAHQSFMKQGGGYLPDKPISKVKEGSIEYTNPKDQVSNLILKNKNLDLDVGFITQISQLYHRKQLLSDDSLVPTFTAIYKTNLREVLDNESLAGGRDLQRAQIMLKMLASGLNHFNDRDWVERTHKGKEYSVNDLATKKRCHGNVKPRNIVLRCASELPDLDKGDDFMPGKWVLSDFSRSTEHGKDYYPAANSAYNPPEVAKRLMSSGERHLKSRVIASAKIDVWQFGCVLFEVLSGTSLFKMEGNNDLIVDEEERGELVNWLSLDEERASLILNQLRATQTYRHVNHYLTLGNVENFTEDEIEKIIKSGKELVQWCLQGDPSHRPSFEEILGHPFFANVDIGRKRVEKDADMIAKLINNGSYDTFEKAGFLGNQPHLHLINTEFEEASAVVKSIEETLSKAGCRLTTDSIKNVSPEEYNKQVKDNVQNARVVACLLTSDCFYKPNVVKQLLYGEDYRMKDEKSHSRIVFIDLTGKVDLSKNNLTWDKAKFSKEWRQTNEFHYLVRSLADEKVELSNLKVDSVNYDDLADGWNDFLKTQFRTMVLSYIKTQVQYQTVDYLKQPMVDKLLLDGHLVPTRRLKNFSVGSPSAKNFADKKNLLNKKLEKRKDKFMNLYFLPSNKVKQGTVRSYVLCAKGQPDETYNAVSAIARALEEPSDNNLIDEASRHKEASDPRNKLINKVKTSYNLKKDSHLKVGGRTRRIQGVKDTILNVTREEGALLLVLYATEGVYKRYGKFLKNALEKRGSDLSLVLVASPGFKVSDHVKEIEEHIPSELQYRFKSASSYIPYNKNVQKTWEYDAFMETIQNVAISALKTPLPREAFSA